MLLRAGWLLLSFVLVACARRSTSEQAPAQPAASQPVAAPAKETPTEPCREATLRTFATDMHAAATEPLTDPQRARMRVRLPIAEESDVALARAQKTAEAAGVVIESWVRAETEPAVTMVVTCP